jgi:proline iminopeptidase
MMCNVWEKVEAARRRGGHGSAAEHRAAYDAPLGLAWFYDPSNESKLSRELNPEVYFTIAGNDADFLVGGDISGLDFRTQLKNLTMPVLITAGRFDRVVPPRLSFQFRSYAPQARFAMFERSGHFIFVEPARFFDVVGGFCQ